MAIADNYDIAGRYVARLSFPTLAWTIGALQAIGMLGRMISRGRSGTAVRVKTKFCNRSSSRRKNDFMRQHLVAAIGVMFLGTHSTDCCAYGLPTDNPVAAFYAGDEGYPAWTDSICWRREST